MKVQIAAWQCGDYVPFRHVIRALVLEPGVSIPGGRGHALDDSVYTLLASGDARWLTENDLGVGKSTAPLPAVAGWAESEGEYAPAPGETVLVAEYRENPDPGSGPIPEPYVSLRSWLTPRGGA
jgi:hypothetical protein